VLVGEPGAAARAREIAARAGLVCEVLPYDRAVHTPLFAPFAEDLRRIFSELPVRTPSGPLWSCTTASPYPEDAEEIRELLVEHWTSPVRFRETIEALYEDGARVFVEAGPRGNMTAFIEDILRGRPACAVASDVPRRSSVTQLNHMAGLLAVHGLDVDLGVLRAGRPGRLVDWEAAAGAGADDELRIPLSTRWPMLTLAPEALERLRASAPAPSAPAVDVRPAVVMQAEPAIANGNGLHDGHGNGDGGHAGEAPRALPAPVATTVLEPALEPVDQDDLAIALAAHHRRMERFLDAGEAIMQTYLGAADAPVAPDAAGPLVGVITDGEPGVRLVARRTVDPAEDRYLRDHTLGREVSRTDPGLTGLALMPMAMSLEILAEAAAALVPERIVTGLRDVRAHRWLAWQDAPRTLEVTAVRLAPAPDGSDRVRVELRELDDPGGPGPAAEGTVLLADAYPAAPPPLAPPLEGAVPGRWEPGGLYAEEMFHGPAWQGVEAVDAVAARGAAARLRVLPRDALLAGTPAPDFALDPVVLDAAGQLIGFWAAQELDSARVVFPFRLAALDLHRPACTPGEPLACVAAIERHGDQLVRSDIEVRDADGRPWMRLTAWEDKRFDVPAHLRPLTRSGALAPMAADWPAPVAGLPGPAAARRIDVRMPADSGLWLPVWAGRVLGRTERSAFAALTRPEGRRLEWLGARTAAKEAVAELLRPYGLDLLPADIAIESDARGMPTVAAPGLDALPVVPVISLSHAAGRAAAIALLVERGAGAGIGLDVEPVRPLPDRFAAAALTPDERAQLDAVPAAAHEEWLLRCWCAKEAAGKAMGAGLAHGTGIPAILGVATDDGTIRVRVAGRELTARTCSDGDLVAATVLRTDDGGTR
jgi:phosphopantetheinyl transferase